MSGPQTEAGKALMEAFTTKPESPDFAIRISQESVIRHAVPAIEQEAVRAYKAELVRLRSKLKQYERWQSVAGKLPSLDVTRALLAETAALKDAE